MTERGSFSVIHPDSNRAAAVITVEHLTKTFPLANPPTTAYRDISFSIEAGEFVCIVGPSGCGKTTLLRTIAGLETASAGSLAWPAEHRTRPPRLAMAFQDSLLLPWLSLRDNVRLPDRSSSVTGREATARSDDWLRRLGLEAFAQFYPHQVSGGMRQRANLARALAVNPDVLLLDEPFAFLDFQTRLGLQQVLLDIWQRERRTVLFVTHDPEEAVALADRVIVLSAHPGTLQTILSIPLPRPREVLALRKEVGYRTLVNELLALLPPSQIERSAL